MTGNVEMFISCNAPCNIFHVWFNSKLNQSIACAYYIAKLLRMQIDASHISKDCRFLLTDDRTVAASVQHASDEAKLLERRAHDPTVCASVALQCVCV